MIALLGIAQLTEWISGKSIPALPWKVKQTIAFVVLQWAQFNAYQAKNDELEKAKTPVIPSLRERTNQLSADILAYDVSSNMTPPSHLLSPDSPGVIEQQAEKIKGFADRFLPQIYVIKEELRKRGITDAELEKAIDDISNTGYPLPDRIRIIGLGFQS